ncbi:hypothetical protein O6P43_016760 [Quillaja saponaria]|uniref:CCHC-type domain-containing protein n=1 Tax=Quillaja saponaria TaxID=32244 RepID=A0AAD7PNS6_QUISA|nr:hypothetical protein O6P43_016760 [Quillaja saponaria]
MDVEKQETNDEEWDFDIDDEDWSDCEDCPDIKLSRASETICHIEYERLHLVCFKCGRYGHYTELCSKEDKVTNGHHEAMKEAEILMHNVDHHWGKNKDTRNNISSNYGDRMFVCKGRKLARLMGQPIILEGNRERNVSKEIRSENGANQGTVDKCSRFEILNDAESMEKEQDISPLITKVNEVIKESTSTARIQKNKGAIQVVIEGSIYYLLSGDKPRFYTNEIVGFNQPGPGLNENTYSKCLSLASNLTKASPIVQGLNVMKPMGTKQVNSQVFFSNSC